MPHLAFHMSVARELAERVQSPTVDADRGAYYLGSTGPDMHIMSRTDRISSHFFDLDCLDDQSSVSSFFEAHGELKDAGALAQGTAAFVAGYLTHLVVDEVWITDIYRPFFGPESPLAGDAPANIRDRILQYDLDIQRRQDTAAMAEIRRGLLASPLDSIDVVFLDPESLRRWRDVAVDMVSRPPSWDRFRHLASRFLRHAGVSTPEEIERFEASIPDLLRETREHVGPERIEGFLEKTTAMSLATLKEYLA